MTKRKTITHCVNLVKIGADNPYTFFDCYSEEEAKLTYMDVMFGSPDDTVQVDKMPSDNPEIVARCKVTGRSGAYIVCLQKIG